MQVRTKGSDIKLYYYGHEMVSRSEYPKVDSLVGLSSIKSQMVAMMNRHGFQGLAAPQVGVPLQLVIVRLEDGSILDLVNPVITRMYGAETASREQCISCPPFDNGCKVPRMQIIHVTAGSVAEPGIMADLRFKGSNSRTIQHQFDHLQGIFFFDRASIKDKADVISRFREWKHNWKLANEPHKENEHGSSSTPKT